MTDERHDDEINNDEENKEVPSEMNDSDEEKNAIPIKKSGNDLVIDEELTKTIIPDVDVDDPFYREIKKIVRAFRNYAKSIAGKYQIEDDEVDGIFTLAVYKLIVSQFFKDFLTGKHTFDEFKAYFRTIIKNLMIDHSPYRTIWKYSIELAKEFVVYIDLKNGWNEKIVLQQWNSSDQKKIRIVEMALYELGKIYNDSTRTFHDDTLLDIVTDIIFDIHRNGRLKPKTGTATIEGIGCFDEDGLADVAILPDNEEQIIVHDVYGKVAKIVGLTDVEKAIYYERQIIKLSFESICEKLKPEHQPADWENMKPEDKKEFVQRKFRSAKSKISNNKERLRRIFPNIP